MASPAHHLRRLRLQVRSADQASAQTLRSQFEAGLSLRLAHVVAAVCDDIGSREDLLRIDRLDLPLGSFAIEELEREAPLALERALREALLQALAAARHNPAPGQRLLAPSEARLDRLATFLRHGLLPHRVASEPFAPADDLLALLRADPGTPFNRRSFLDQLLRGLAAEHRRPYSLLLRQLAQSQQLVYSLLLRTFATALRRLPRPLALQTSLPALLDSLLAAELADSAQADGAPAPDHGLAATSSTEAGVAEPAAASSPSASTSSPSPSIDLSG